MKSAPPSSEPDAMLKTFDTNTLTGRLLDQAVALSLGYRWAVNMSPRSGDSFARYNNRDHVDVYPVGALMLIGPDFTKGVEPGKPSWAKWGVPGGVEEYAPDPLREVPQFHRDREEAMGVLIGFTGHLCPKLPVEPGSQWQCEFWGPYACARDVSPLRAVWTAFVLHRLGNTVDLWVKE